MSSRYIPAGNTTERSEKGNQCTHRQRPFQDLSESLKIFAVRQTVLEICSIFVFWHFANADPYGSSKVKGEGEFGKVVYDFLLVFNSNHGAI